MNEILFSNIFSLSPQMIAITNQKDGTVIMANPVFSEVLGFSEEEYINKSTIELKIWQNPEERSRIISEISTKGIVRNKEVTFRTKYGKILTCHFSATPMVYNSQDCLIVIVSDITEQKMAEQAFLNSEFRFKKIVENLPIALSIVNPAGNIQYINSTFYKYFGYTLNDIPNFKRWTKLAYPDEEYRQHCISTWQKDIAEIKEGKITFSAPRIYRINTKSNQTLDVEIIFTFIDNDIYSIFTDITEKFKAEKALKASEQKFVNIFTLSPFMVGITRVYDGMIIDCNPELTNIIGYSRNECIGKTTKELGWWINYNDRTSIIKLLEENTIIKNFEVHLRTKAGKSLTCLFSCNKINISQEECLIFVIHDISDRKLAEEKLQRSEERLKKAQVIGQIGYTEQLIDSQEIWASAEGMRIFGYPPIDGYVEFEKVKSCIINYDLFQKSYYELVQNGKKFDVEYAINPADGSPQRYIHEIVDVEMDSKGKPYELLGIFQDITKRKKVEEALQKRVFALTKPIDEPEGINFTDLFDIEELQHLQDAFSNATGVASIITHPNGTPITKASNFCRLCNMIRDTDKGRENCYKSDAIIGKQNIHGPIVQPCLSGGLWDAGAGITVGGKHIANWLIGQVRNESQDENRIINYADEVGLSREEFKMALQEVPAMSKVQFEKVSHALFILANQLSIKAYQNVQQARFIAEQQKAEEALRKSESNYRDVFNATSDAMFVHEMPSGKVIDINNAMLQMYGYDTKEEVLSSETESFIVNKPPYTLDKAMEMLRMANEAESQTFEWMIQHNKTKELRWAEVSLTRSDIGGANRILASVRDITERRNAEELLKKSEAILKATMESMIDGVLVVSSEGKITNWNTRFCEIFGIQNDLIATQNDELLLNFAKKQLVDPESFHRQVQAIYRTNLPTEDTLYLTNGQIIERVSFPLSGDSPISGRVWLFRDITERKKAEEALQQNQTLLKESQRVARIGNWEYYFKDNKLVWSEETFKIFGYNYQEINPTFENFFQLVNPTERDFVKLHLQKSLEEKEFKSYECSITLRNGEQRYIYVVGEVSTNNNNEAYRSFGIIQDITERKKNEAILQEKEAKIKSIFTAAPVGITLIIDRIFQECNDAFYEITGYSPNEIIGQSTQMLYVSEEDYMLIGEVPIPDIQDSGLESFETTWQRKDGRIINVLLNSIAINPNDQTKGFIFTVLDITERKQAELEIKKMNTELEERVIQRTIQLERANKDLEAFAYSVSHDLRAPLRHVDGFVRLLYSNIDSPSESITNYFEKINSASKRMSRMIDDLLSFSRLGRRELVETEIDLDLLIRDIIEQFKPDTSNRTIEWNILQLPKIHGDKHLMYQAFENLIANAIKYTSPKPKAIIAIGSSTNTNEGMEIYVKDNGVGFDMAYIDKLFGVFQRLHSSEEFEGTGIGLANVKQIINKHGGTIRAEGKINEGAIFYISLPK
ncbi:hypothetical protein CYCD_28530 [Tenuifilaceae bacterium CYCD]|nr:hypothetical protein CYCD_28530 [Tenuifilaceae bacterium CYCD]